LKRAVARSIGHFWPFPHAQIYSEPERLVSAELLQVELEMGGRHRRTYSITSDGRRQLREWLKTPVGEVFQIRNVAEIKLFFAELGNPSDVVALARQQVASHKERLAAFEAMQARFANQSELAPRLIPLALGLELERVALRFWEAQIPDEGKQEDQAAKMLPV
jgi:DNA-binding PadR family transcriptional regulator